MAHDIATKTVDYSMEQPPEWYTPQERIDYHPARAAWFISQEMKRVEAEMAAKKAAQESEVATE